MPLFQLRSDVRRLVGLEKNQEQRDEQEEDSEVLDSGYSHEEIRGDVEEREEFLSHLDKEIEKAERKAKMHFREALQSEGAEKRRHYRKANGYKTYRDQFQEISEQVANGQESLAVMDVEAVKEKLAKRVEDLGFDIDVTEMPVDDVASSIEDNSFENREREKVRNQLQRSQQVAGDTEPPYQELMDEGDTMEAEQIQQEVDELAGGDQGNRDDELDEQIRQDLEDL